MIDPILTRSMILTVVVLASFVGSALAAEDHADPAPVAEFFGETYTFVQADATARIDELLSRLTSQVVPPSGEKSERSVIPKLPDAASLDVVELGWVVVAMGRFADGNDDVRDLLYRVKREAGFAGIPYWVCTEKQRLLLLLAASRGPQAGRNDPMQSLGRFSRSMFQLVEAAQREITERTGYKFTDYTGPVYSN